MAEKPRKRTCDLRERKASCPSSILPPRGWPSLGPGWAQKVYSQPPHLYFLLWWGTGCIRSPWTGHFSDLPSYLGTPSIHSPSGLYVLSFFFGHATLKCRVLAAGLPGKSSTFYFLRGKIFCLLLCSFSPHYMNINSNGARDLPSFHPVSQFLKLCVMHGRHWANIAERMTRTIQHLASYKAYKASYNALPCITTSDASLNPWDNHFCWLYFIDEEMEGSNP